MPVLVLLAIAGFRFCGIVSCGVFCGVCGVWVQLLVSSEEESED